MSTYVYDHAWHDERQRLALTEETFDPGTIRHLEARGVGPGWRCLEVGGGGGSIAAWLARRVAPGGHVLATDLDTRFLDALARPNLEVRRHDIVADDLPDGAFNLVHARAVLHHLPARDHALERMAAALTPGGWLVVEDLDWGSFQPDPALGAAAAVVPTVWAAHERLFRSRGIDAYLGRGLYGRLLRLGLVEVEAAGDAPMIRGGSPRAALLRMTTASEHLRAALLDGGEVSEDDLAAYAALLDDPTVTLVGPLMVTAWGRRPPG